MVDMEEAVDGVGDEEGEKECCFKKSKIDERIEQM